MPAGLRERPGGRDLEAAVRRQQRREQRDRGQHRDRHDGRPHGARAARCRRTVARRAPAPQPRRDRRDRRRLRRRRCAGTVLTRPRRRRGPPPAAGACRRCEGVVKICSVGPCSTITPAVHDRDLVGDGARGGEVVGDEQQRDAERRAQVAEQVEHLRGERDVERRDRLVAGQQRRRYGDRAGDRGALAHPARQPARNRAGRLLGQPDGGERRGDPRRALAGGDVERGEPLADLVADRQPGRQRRAGVLEDELRRRAGTERDAAARRLEQADDHPQQRRLPRARLADDRQRAAGGQRRC